jgi:hypothetical protein
VRWRSALEIVSQVYSPGEGTLIAWWVTFSQRNMVIHQKIIEKHGEIM